MAQQAPVLNSADAERNVVRVREGTDLIEWYFEQGWTDGLPVVPPTRPRVDAVVEALGGDAHFVECKVPGTIMCGIARMWGARFCSAWNFLSPVTSSEPLLSHRRCKTWLSWG